MKKTFTTAAAAAAVWALVAVPGIAQSSGSGSSSSGSSQQGGAAEGSGATDQQGSTHGGQAGSGAAGQSGSGEAGTSGESGTGQSGSGSGSGATGTSGGSTTGSTGSRGSAATASSEDRAFILEAAAGGLAEVELGRLASQKAARGEVKEFGQMMVTDHTKANEQLMKIAQAKSVDAPHALKPEHKAMKDQLSKLSGEAFDRAYIQHMVKDHQEDVAHFRKESTEASDPDVKQFASATLPTLQKHLKRAQEIEQIVNASR
jgi:putative membrane protein